MDIKKLKESLNSFLTTEEKKLTTYAYSIGIYTDKVNKVEGILKDAGLFVDGRDKLHRGNPISVFMFHPETDLKQHRKQTEELLKQNNIEMPTGASEFVNVSRSEDMTNEKKEPCWSGYEMIGMKEKNGREVPNCVPIKEGHEGCGCEEDYTIEEYDVESAEDYAQFIPYLKEWMNVSEPLVEVEHHGKKVRLGKIMKGDVKKYKVYVKNPQGNVVKVNFGDKKMSIKRDNPTRRKNFRARHRCSNPGPRHKARYWACRTWSTKPVSQMLKGK